MSPFVEAALWAGSIALYVFVGGVLRSRQREPRSTDEEMAQAFACALWPALPFVKLITLVIRLGMRVGRKRAPKSNLPRAKAVSK